MKELQQLQVDATNSALLIVDVQKEPDNYRDVPDPDRKRRIVPTVRGLVDRARAAGVRVIYSQSIRNGEEPEFTVFGRVPILQVGTWHSEILDEVQPAPEDIVVRKWGPDPWHETDCERIFRGLFPDPTKCKVLVTGGSITGCAYFAVMGLYVRGYQVVIVTDAIYEYSIAQALGHFSRTTYPSYPNIVLSRSDLIEFQKVPSLEPQTAGR